MVGKKVIAFLAIVGAAAIAACSSERGDGNIPGAGSDQVNGVDEGGTSTNGGGNNQGGGGGGNSNGNADAGVDGGLNLDTVTDPLFFLPQGQTQLASLVQQCQQCHNKTLDQTETREKFRVDDLANMSREEKDLAIHRLSLPDDVFRQDAAAALPLAVPGRDKARDRRAQEVKARYACPRTVIDKSTNISLALVGGP